MAAYRMRQEQLPGIRRAPVPGEPVPDRDLVSGGHQSGVPSGAHLVSTGHQSGGYGTPDSKAFDPNAINPNAEIRERALLWAEKNRYAYRAFSRELDLIYGAAIGAHNFNKKAAVIKAAQKAGVPDHISASTRALRRLMSRCKQPECKFAAWRQRLCYLHWKESLGFVFDSVRKVFAKAR
jgi:hypothetical protein